MTSDPQAIANEIKDLRLQLAEAEQTLRAIRAGEVDAVVIEGANAHQVYTLESPDRPFRIFVEQMQEGALTVNEQGTIVYCNRYFASLVGQPLEQVIGASMDRFIAPSSHMACRSLLKAAGDRPVHGECTLLKAGDLTVPARLAVGALPAQNLRLLGIVITDLSDRERAQKLEVARRAAEQAGVARDQFLAVVSHELRTPLNAILGWAQMLARVPDLPHQASHGISVIERNARAQTKLINDLLDVSRILAGKLRLDLQQVDLREIIDAALPSLRPAAEAKEIDLVPLLDPGLGRVSGDAGRLQQIVWNLLSNAIKHTPRGGRVEIRLRRNHAWAEIEVADTGIGMSPEFLPKLFGLFEQADTSSTRSGGGLGLGLAIVKQIAQLHGGSVHAHSEGEGKGSTFTVRLPLRNATAPHEPDDSRLPESGSLAGALEGLSILVVEDDHDAREMVACLVENWGGKAFPAASAHEALVVLDNRKIDLLISDIGMPGMDGYEFIHRVRADGRTARELPAVAVTAFAHETDRRRALLAGFQTHLAKPVDPEELGAVIASLCGRTVL